VEVNILPEAKEDVEVQTDYIKFSKFDTTTSSVHVQAYKAGTLDKAIGSPRALTPIYEEKRMS
jgi:hypothetical protein